MPPRSMFREKRRPSGMEFATCADCNQATSGADVVASFFARMRPDNDVSHWQIAEIENLKASLERNAAGVAHELFREAKSKKIFQRTPSGLLVPVVEVHADGPLLRSYMGVFASKLGMAFYREHVGAPLPIDGAVYSHWYLNAGLRTETMETMLRILPRGSSLRQGAFRADDQFSYQFNCDEKTIVAALAHFHAGLHVFVIATSNPNFYLAKMPDFPTMTLARPGELIAMIPERGPRFWK